MSRGARRAVAVAALALLALAAAAAATPRWGWLGVRIRDLSEQEMEDISKRHGIREGFGAMIVEVLKDTPAEASGLRNGDLVVNFRDRLVVDTRTLIRVVAAAPVGESITLEVLRKEEGRRRLTVRLVAMPPPIAAERVAGEFGFVVRDPAREGPGGEAAPGSGRTVVAMVAKGGPAERAGLRAGDVLLEVNGRPTVSLDAVRDVLAGAALDRPLSLVVRRDADLLPVTVPPAARTP